MGFLMSDEVRRHENMKNMIGAGNSLTIMDFNDEAALRAHDSCILGFEGESAMSKALIAIANRMMEAAGMADDMTEDIEDIGMIVNVSRSDVADYGEMVDGLMNARNIRELNELAELYRNIPGALKIAEICAERMGGRITLAG